jgi:hypothetical protein
MVTPGASATSAQPEEFHARPLRNKGGAPYVNDLAHAMAEVRPVTAFFSGTTTFGGSPQQTPFCAQYADRSLGYTAPGTPYSRCYVWLDTKP